MAANSEEPSKLDQLKKLFKETASDSDLVSELRYMLRKCSLEELDKNVKLDIYALGSTLTTEKLFITYVVSNMQTETGRTIRPRVTKTIHETPYDRCYRGKVCQILNNFNVNETVKNMELKIIRLGIVFFRYSKEIEVLKGNVRKLENNILEAKYEESGVRRRAKILFLELLKKAEDTFQAGTLHWKDNKEYSDELEETIRSFNDFKKDVYNALRYEKLEEFVPDPQEDMTDEQLGMEIQNFQRRLEGSSEVLFTSEVTNKVSQRHCKVGSLLFSHINCLLNVFMEFTTLMNEMVSGLQPEVVKYREQSHSLASRYKFHNDMIPKLNDTIASIQEASDDMDEFAKEFDRSEEEEEE